MALSMKNTIASLALSGAMLFAGYLTSETPIVSAKGRVGVAAERQESMRASTKTPVNDSLKKTKRTFAAPYFSFGNAGIVQGVKQ
jgi:hypothetical protein